MVSNQGARPRDHTRFAKRTLIAPTKERDYPSGAAETYDLLENDLITKTRKIIAASKKAVRDAEAVLKRR